MSKGVLVVVARMRILAVVAGLVMSVLVLVPPVAAETVDPGVLNVTDFVALGVDGVYLKQGASVVSGDVGAVNATDGPYLAGSQETTVGQNVTVPAGSRVFGDSTKLKQGSTVGDVYTNELTGDGTMSGTLFTPVAFPLDVTLPAIPVAQPGTADLDVAQGDTIVLDPASYGLLKARRDATVTLTGGTYQFADWDIGDRVVVEVLAPSQIVVAGRVDMGKNSALSPGTGVEPFEVELTALGQNGNTGKVGATPKAAKFGVGSTVSARVWAPNGTVWLRQDATGVGQFIGRWVTVGIGVTVERSVEEGPIPPPSVGLGSPAEGAVVFETEVVEADVATSGALSSVELLVDGIAVGMMADANGDGTHSVDWDTRTSNDGTAVLEVVAVDMAGNVVVSDPVTVMVGNGSNGVADRISVDYARGLITADEYATYGLQSLMNAVDLPERYAWNFLADGSAEPVDGTQAALTFLKDWDQMSLEVQQAVIGLGAPAGPVTGDFTPDESSGAQAQRASAAAAGFTSADFPDCMEKTEAYVIRTVGFPAPVLPKAFECRTVFDHATVYWNVNSGTFWDVVQVLPPIVVPLRKDALVDFGDNDGHLGEGNGVPDYIDRIGNQTDIAWEVYDDMGYSQPVSVNVYVSELDYTDDAPNGFVLPGPLVQFDNDAAITEYLPRHELFHVAQFEHMLGGLDVSDLLDFYDGTRWWMEATAEWGAHQTMLTTGAPSALPVTDNSGMDYAEALPALLNSPEGSLIDVDWVLGLDVPSPRSYGSFIFAEYLDENLAFTDAYPWPGAADAVRRTWDKIGDGATSTTPQRAIEEVIAESTTGDSLATVLGGFGIANYLMDEPVHAAYGYSEPDANDWKSRLSGGRPLSEPVALIAGSVESGSVVLGRGGSHYVEFTSDDAGSAGEIELAPTAVDGVGYTALRVTTDSENGATLCDDGIDPVVALSPDTTTAVPVDGGCDTVTLVATYTDLDSDTRTAGWEALLTGDDNLLVNPGFETGDDSGWVPFREPQGGVLMEVISSADLGPFLSIRTGEHAAHLNTGEFLPLPAGWEQTVAVTPGVGYYGSAWVGDYRGVGRGFGVEILDAADRSILARNTNPSMLWGQWGRASLSFTSPPSGEVIYRLVTTADWSGEAIDVVFDDALLIEQPPVEFKNTGFDDGLDSWTVLGGSGGTVTPAIVDGATTIELGSLDGDAVGVEQQFDGFHYNAADAVVSVGSGDEADVLLEILRLDGTVIASWSETLNAADGWVSIGDVGWGYRSEDILVYRITTSGPGTVLVDTASVGLAT